VELAAKRGVWEFAGWPIFVGWRDCPQIAVPGKEWARLSEVGTPEQQAAHSAYRQALRDIPQSIDLDKINTAGKLEVFQPAWPEQP
jgi:hypothetical protein